MSAISVFVSLPAVYCVGMVVMDGGFFLNHRNAPKTVAIIVNKAREIFRATGVSLRPVQKPKIPEIHPTVPA